MRTAPREVLPRYLCARDAAAAWSRSCSAEPAGGAGWDGRGAPSALMGYPLQEEASGSSTDSSDNDEAARSGPARTP